MNQLIEYMKLHLISLEQDKQLIYDKPFSIWSDEDEIEDISLNGQIIATRHLMSVANDILGIQPKENNA